MPKGSKGMLKCIKGTPKMHQMHKGIPYNALKACPNGATGRKMAAQGYWREHLHARAGEQRSLDSTRSLNG